MDIKSVLKISLLEVKNNYSQSMLGSIWFFLNPLIFFLSYYFFSIYMLGGIQHGLDRFSSFLFISINLSVFLVFSNSLMTACGNFVSSLDLFRNTSYNPTPFLLKYVILAGSTYVPIILIAFIARFYSAAFFDFKCAIFILYITALELIFIFSLILIFSCLVTIIRDLLNILQWSMFCLMFISPLGFKADNLYQTSKVLYYCNPLNYFLIPIQKMFFNGDLPDTIYLLSLTAFVMIFFWISLKIFNILKMIVIDYV